MAALPTRSAHAFLLAGLIGAGTTPGGAEEPILPPPLEVEVRGLRSLSAETIEHYLFSGAPPSDAEGRELDPERLNAGLHELWRRGLVDSVRIWREIPDGRARIIVEVEERPILAVLDTSGLERLDRATVSERIDSDRIAVLEGRPLRRGELERLRVAIEAIYREKGFRFAEVTARVEERSAGEVSAVFAAELGDRVKIGSLRFDGNTVFSDLRLRLAMKRSKKAGPISDLTKKSLFNPAHLEEDLERVRELYRRAGFKDVTVGRPEVELRPGDRPGGRRLAVRIPIEEGERWRLGDVTIEGNESLADAVLLRQLEPPAGGWLRSTVIDAGREKIAQLYQSIGYPFAEIDVELRERPRRVADVVVHVQENDRYTIGRIEFEGNSKTRDKVLRRELLLQEGGLLNMAAIERSLLRLRQQNAFELDEAEPVRFDFDSESRTVDLLLRGAEADRTEIQFGGGLAEDRGLFAQASFRSRNFLGRGETLGLSAQLGSEADLFRLDYGIPWLLDRPQTLGVKLFDQRYDTPVGDGLTVLQELSGAEVSYGRRLGAFQRLTLGYGWSEQSLALDGGGEAPSFATASLRPAWIHDTVDSRFNPTRGLRATGALAFAGRLLGGDSDFLRPTAGIAYFRPVRRRPFPSSFGIRAEAGHLLPLSGDSLLTVDRFRLGGPNSLRGFRSGSLYSLNEDGSVRLDERGLPLGGQSMVQLNLELHVDLRDPLRLVLFTDVGSAFDGTALDTDLLRWSAGAELRVQLPIFGAPVRLIWAENLNPLAGDRFRSLDFAFNTSF